MQKKISLEKSDYRAFFGNRNIYFKYIVSKFPDLKISARGATIKVVGETATEIDRFEKKVNQTLQYMTKYGHISNEVIDQFFDSIAIGPIEHTEDKNRDKDIVIHGNNNLIIRPRGANQKRLVESVINSDLLFAIGPAGTGKTYIAIAMAVRALRNREVKKIILTRPAVEAGEKLGFLPGDIKDKLDPYLQPLYDALHDMIPARKLSEHIESKIIQIIPLAYMRGRTLDNAFVILDEAQNATLSQLKMFLTRMGKSAKFVITGDCTQIDLPYKQDSGLETTTKMLEAIEGVAVVEMQKRDIVRHQLVKRVIEAFENIK